MTGCGGNDEQSAEKNASVEMNDSLEVGDAWARPAAAGATTAIYFTLSNGTASTDTLLGINSDISESVEMHETYTREDETTGMRPAGIVAVPSGEQLILEPGGLHIMMMDLENKLEVGDSVLVELEFAGEGQIRKWVPVKN